MKSFKNSLIKSAVLSLSIAMLACACSYGNWFTDIKNKVAAQHSSHEVGTEGATSITVFNSTDVHHGMPINVSFQTAKRDGTDVRTEIPFDFHNLEGGAYATYPHEASDRIIGLKGAKMMVSLNFGWGNSETISIEFNG